MAKYAGVDMSKWQQAVNYPKLSKAVINGGKNKFAMLRIGIDKTPDALFAKHYNGCRENGIYIGVYYYSMARNPVEAKREALWVIERLKAYEIEYPIAFDYEDRSLQALNLGRDMYTQIADVFLSTILEANYYPILYTNPDWLENRFNKRELLDKYDLWLAQYTLDGLQKDYGQTMWQYGVDTVSGVTGDCDCNWAYIGYAKKIRELKMNIPISKYVITGVKTVTSERLIEEQNKLKSLGFETTSRKA